MRHDIRDNEHIHRVEQPVYKRRWDEQWKVSNRWLAGPVACVEQLVDAFRWWLAEKAENLKLAESNKAQAVRGRLNVPREPLQQTGDGQYVWAGKDR